MIALLQRVTHASVVVQGERIAVIDGGLLVLVCAERGDSEREADLLLAKLMGYRVFADAAGKTNLSLVDVGGGLLLVPQFTLAASTNSGTRPSFASAAAPADGKRLFDYMLAQAGAAHPVVQSGQFGADMQVTLTNDGPATFWLQVKPRQQ